MCLNHERAPNRLDANSDTRSGISVLNYIRMYIVVIYVLILDDFFDQLLSPKKITFVAGTAADEVR